MGNVEHVSLVTADQSSAINPAKEDGNLQTVARQSGNKFSRIKNKIFLDTEEVRYDIPATLISGTIYTAIALSGTATSSASWDIVRTDFDSNGNPTRDRYRTGVAWDSRTSGW